MLWILTLHANILLPMAGQWIFLSLFFPVSSLCFPVCAACCIPTFFLAQLNTPQSQAQLHYRHWFRFVCLLVCFGYASLLIHGHNVYAYTNWTCAHECCFLHRRSFQSLPVYRRSVFTYSVYDCVRCRDRNNASSICVYEWRKGRKWFEVIHDTDETSMCLVCMYFAHTHNSTCLHISCLVCLFIWHILIAHTNLLVCCKLITQQLTTEQKIMCMRMSPIIVIAWACMHILGFHPAQLAMHEDVSEVWTRYSSNTVIQVQ